jgi:hypothetical protein
VFDTRGNLAFAQNAEAVRDGEWRAALTSEQTARLEVGSNRLEVIFVSRAVSIPSFESMTFITQ